MPFSSGVGPGCRLGAALVSTSSTMRMLADQQVSLLAAAPGCSGPGLVRLQASTEGLFARPPWKLDLYDEQFGTSACNTTAQICSDLMGSIHGLDASSLSAENASILGTTGSPNASHRIAGQTWNGEALIRHASIAGCLLSQG